MLLLVSHCLNGYAGKVASCVNGFSIFLASVVVMCQDNSLGYACCMVEVGIYYDSLLRVLSCIVLYFLVC